MFENRVKGSGYAIVSGIIGCLAGIIGFIMCLASGIGGGAFGCAVIFVLCLILVIHNVAAELRYDACMSRGTLKKAKITDIREVSTGRHYWMVDHHITVEFKGDDGMTHESDILVDSDTAHSYCIGMEISVNVYQNHAAL